MVKLFVCCLVDSEWQALNIVERFRSRGFSNNEISVLFLSRSGTPRQGQSDPDTSCEGLATSVLDGALGWLAGFGPLQLPQLGPCVGAGPLMESLNSWKCSVINDISTSLRAFGISENRAQHYAERIGSGEILIAVHPTELERANQAEQILSRLGANDIGHSGSVALASLGATAVPGPGAVFQGRDGRGAGPGLFGDISVGRKLIFRQPEPPGEPPAE